MKRFFSELSNLFILIMGSIAVTGTVLLCLSGTGVIRRGTVFASDGVWSRGGRTEAEQKDPAVLSVLSGDIEGYLTIPLPSDTAYKGYEIVQDVSHRKTAVFIRDVSEDFYSEHPFSGSSEHVSGLFYRYRDKTAELEVLTEGVFEPEIKEENGKLYLGFVSPGERFPRVYVIDPGHGGNDHGYASYGIKEKDVALQTALKLLNDLSDDDHGVYLTRYADESVKDSERSEFISALEPDAVISIHVDADPETRTSSGITAAALNGGDPALAESMERGLSEATGLEILKRNDTEGCEGACAAGIPCYRIGFGVITNKRDATFISQEDAESAAAGAVAEAIRAYENGKKQ